MRIMGVPKSIGAWRITEVYAALHYPDDSERTKLAVREGNVYVATLDGCQTAGKVENGLTISANGIDEDGNAVAGYVLGRGDVYVMEGDSVVPDPTAVKNYVKLCDSLPETPAKGDAYFQNGVLVIYDGTNWVPAFDGAGIHGDYIEDADGNKIEADRTFTWREKSPWYIHQLQEMTYDPPLECAWGTYTIDDGQSQTQQQMWISTTPYSASYYFGMNADLDEALYLSKNGDIYIVGSGDYIGDHTPNAITDIGGTEVSITRTGEWSDRTATLATEDWVEGKGYITASQVPTPSYIEDGSGNKIEADGDFTYLDGTKWTVSIGTYGTYALSPSATDVWTYAEAEGTEGNKKVVLYWSDGEQAWRLEYYQWSDVQQTWYSLAYGTSYEPHQATTLEITISGDFTEACECQKGVPTTVKLATETYAVENDGGVAKVKAMTEQAYEDLAAKDSTTLYVITES